MRDQWIKRVLANARVVSDAVMAPYGREVLARLSAQGQTVVLLIDQTKVSERHQVVMVAVPCRWPGGGRRPRGRSGLPSSARRLRRRHVFSRRAPSRC